MGERDDKIRQAELTLEAMERDGMAACERVPPDRPPAWDKSAALTDEQKAAPYFVVIARCVWRKGRGYLIPWLWDRYCDGKDMAEAYQVVMRQVAKEQRAKEEDPEPTPERTDWMTEYERKGED
jgi:hypothetical protein